MAERLPERLIGSIRRERLDHIIIGNERGLRHVLHAYVTYYLRSRTHVSLDKDAPITRLVASLTDGQIVTIPHLGGLHHHYERRAAQDALPPRLRVPLGRGETCSLPRRRVWVQRQSAESRAGFASASDANVECPISQHCCKRVRLSSW
jgi:hypothetical protein